METAVNEPKIHYDPREIYGPSHTLAMSQEQKSDGIHTYGTSRTVYVTVDGDFAGSMHISTEGGERERYPMCYGQRDQIIGVPAKPGEQAGAELIARYYRKGDGW